MKRILALIPLIFISTITFAEPTFCNAGLVPDGYVDFSAMPTAPNFPGGGGIFSAVHRDSPRHRSGGAHCATDHTGASVGLSWAGLHRERWNTHLLGGPRTMACSSVSNSAAQ